MAFPLSARKSPFSRESPSHVILVRAFTDRLIRLLKDANLQAAFEKLSEHRPEPYTRWASMRKLPLERLRMLLLKARASAPALGLQPPKTGSSYNAAGSSPGHGSGPGLGSSGSGSSGGIGTGGASSLRWLATDRNTALAGSRKGSVSATSQSQQSLHRRQRSHRWLLQESFVHRAQMRVESSPQMLQVNGMVYCFFFPFLAAGAVSVPRQRCAS
jgi:hypothetical protein